MTALAGWVMQRLAPEIGNASGRLRQVGATVLAALASYALLALILRLDEFWMLLRRHRDSE
jgi:hypothetical protein